MEIKQNIDKIRQLITQVAQENNREATNIMLLAVSKKQNVASITEAFQQGITNFGENYYQEALFKIQELKHLPICWHFLGPVQSNKCKGIATEFSWVHSITRKKIALLLNEQRPSHFLPLNVCLQINLIAEETKAGIEPGEAMELAKSISLLPHLNLRGLMTLPPPQKNPVEQYNLFKQLNYLMHAINKEGGLNMDTLSMGMSDDLIPAIQAGSTIVRIGRAIFGERS